jgi:arsenate reductase (thioredoxin)
MVSDERTMRVLFLCTHNSARSQMAEGLLRSLGGNGVEVESAGTEASFVRPEAISVMNELGIDISRQESKTLEQFLNQPFDDVITVCDKAFESCPFFPGAHHQRHWSIDDPAAVVGTEDVRLAAFRAARDELKQRIEDELLPDLNPGSNQ